MHTCSHFTDFLVAVKVWYTAGMEPKADGVLYEWTASEHVHQVKSNQWYAAYIATGLLVVGAFVLLGSYLAALSLALIFILLFYIARREPALVRYRLMAEGVAINTVLYPYQNLTAFNVIYEPGGTKVVLLRPKRRLMPFIYLEVGDADPVTIRDILLEFVLEDQELQEPFSDILARRLGF